MTTNDDPAFPITGATSTGGSGQQRALSPAAQRALAEAAIRRAEIDRKRAERPPESGGRAGPDPVRYGDWEVNGLASDF